MILGKYRPEMHLLGEGIKFAKLDPETEEKLQVQDLIHKMSIEAEELYYRPKRFKYYKNLD